MKTDTVIEVRRDRVRPFEGQPREYFNQSALRDLARSIKAAGQQVPITVRPLLDDPAHDYELIDGQRRWLACGMIGRDVMKAWVRNDVGGREDQFLASVVANFAREGHSAIEVAKAIGRLRKHPALRDLAPTAQHEKIAEIFGKSTSWVYQHEALLKLHPEVLVLMHPAIPDARRLTLQLACLLVPLPADTQLAVAKAVVTKALPVAKARKLVVMSAKQHGIELRSEQPSTRRERMMTLLTRISDEAERVAEMPVSELRELAAGIGASELESYALRVENARDHLGELGSALRRFLRPSRLHASA